MTAYLPVVELFTGEVEVLIQRVCLVAFPVLQLDLQHIALPVGQLRDKLVPQPVLSQRAPEPLRPRALQLACWLFFVSGIHLHLHMVRSADATPY